MLNYKHYKANPVLDFPERTWPSKTITHPPIWCSVDLRDGNQALIEPMTVEEKIEMFNLLLRLGFKEIEIGFPAASQIEYDFLRVLVDKKMIPDDVKVQILCQCRKELIERSFEAIQGIKNVVFHIYNSTSTLQRDVVFKKDKDAIVDIALDGVRWVKENLKNFDGNLQLEYSPESFTGTEPEFAARICNEVYREWGRATDNKVIMNLPATVEMNTPNVYADQVEWVGAHFDHRDDIIISLHPHNDRGTGTACAELGLLAGADRIEGTLLGNGERTGNVDILTVAYNMFSQGINPGLDIENINEIVEVYERICKMTVDPRHPYAGKLVFTAFSGSHQDAINKGVHAIGERKGDIWEVPYLPIDPSDIGREYEPLVRINSQSGKGGVAFVMETVYGYKLPKAMHGEFAKVVQRVSEKEGGELKPQRIMEEFKSEYLKTTEPFELVFVDTADRRGSDDTEVTVDFRFNGEEFHSVAEGNGPINAIKTAIRQIVPDIDFEIKDYTEHSLTKGDHSKAAAYIAMENPRTGNTTYGVGVSSNITRAGIRAVFSALNHMIKQENA